MKIAIVTSHPIQYYAPWFRYLANTAGLSLRVFYLWDFGITRQVDVGFQQALQWDIPLLEGYESEFVSNVSANPGTSHFWGLQNPSLVQRVRAYQPDAVLMIGYNYASLYRFLLTWNHRQIPLIFRGDSHRLLPTTSTKEWLRRQVISTIYRQFTACLYVGKANYDYFRYHQVAPERLFFAPHAVDNDRFFAQTETAKQDAIAWKQTLGIPSQHQVVLFVGKLEAKKRPLDLLQAFLQANLDQVSLLFVGSGELQDQLKNQAANHPHIHFATFQNQTQMPRVYAIADVVVLPSHGGDESWGLAINEAMCMARAVIVSSHVGCARDLVHPHHNGLVFPSGDVSALTICLQTAFSDRQRLANWGAESRRIISGYSYAAATQGLQQALSFLHQVA
jgi:glycosyltransferase involved in cell wall biosynthesis